MRELQSDETELVGKWVERFGGFEADAVCARIEWLTKECLRKIGVDPKEGGWVTLFADPKDGRFWERTYPKGDLHGGGPPKLSGLSKEEAVARYGVEILESAK